MFFLRALDLCPKAGHSVVHHGVARWRRNQGGRCHICVLERTPIPSQSSPPISFSAKGIKGTALERAVRECLASLRKKDVHKMKANPGEERKGKSRKRSDDPGSSFEERKPVYKGQGHSYRRC